MLQSLSKVFSYLLFVFCIHLYSLPSDAIVKRTIPTVGEIITTNGDERLKFIELPPWYLAEINQNIATDDQIKTGPFGSLALLFHDETQIRIHRNSDVIIKQTVNPTSEKGTALRLNRGATWSRAKPNPRGIKIETPSATAAIRGTDWYLVVDANERSTLTVLSGQVAFFNSFGEIIVTPGELGIAELGKAPRKIFIVTPKDKPQWHLAIETQWLDLLSLSNEKTTTLLEKQVSNHPQLNIVQHLEQAQIAYDLGHFSVARRIINNLQDNHIPQVQHDSIQLLNGFLLLREDDIEQASLIFEQLQRVDEESIRILAALGFIGTLVQQQRYSEAMQSLHHIQQQYPKDTNAVLLQVWLTSFQGRHQDAVDLLLNNKSLFLDDVRLPALLAHLHLLLDDTIAMKIAIDNALTIDPLHPFAWHWQGLYYHLVEPDAAQALEAYYKVLNIRPHYPATLNNLGLLHMELGDYDIANEWLLTAVKANPNNWLPQISLATLLHTLDQNETSQSIIEHVLLQDPGNAHALEALGMLQFKQGNIDTAIITLLKATAANPGVVNIDSTLAMVLYQAERFTDAQKALSNARRLDVNSPLPFLLSSIIAQDRAEANTAIQQAQLALQKYRSWGNFATNTIASTQAGATNLGQAFSFLGLRDWGALYSQRYFNPYQPDAYFYLTNFYPFINAQQSSLTQALLFEPTAISGSQRYFEFVRQRRKDVSLFTQLGNEQGNTQRLWQLSAQGFQRNPQPQAYQVAFSHNVLQGSGENNQVKTTTAQIRSGWHLDFNRRVSFDATMTQQQKGLPSLSQTAQLDDQQNYTTAAISMGYYRRNAAKNHTFFRVRAIETHETYTNGNAFGRGLNNRDYSLLSAFGLPQAQTLYQQGLYEIPATTPAELNQPFYIIGDNGKQYAQSPLPNTITDHTDFNRLSKQDQKSRSITLYTKKALDIASIHWNFGGEWHIQRDKLLTISNIPQEIGTGFIGQALDSLQPFPLLTNIEESQTETHQSWSGQVYAHGWRKYFDTLWWESAMLLQRYTDRDDDDITQWNPRLGLAWAPSNHHWFRFAAQRRLRLPVQQSLAPLATLGLLAPEPYQQPGSRSTDYQLRWDSQWSHRIYSFAFIEQQNIKKFTHIISSDKAFFSEYIININHARIRTLGLGTNIWLAKGWGLAITQQWHHTENQSTDIADNLELPFVPKRRTDMAITWVHPSQIRANWITQYHGASYNDITNTNTLPSYWISDFSLNWLSNKKYWSITFNVNNVFDKQYDKAIGIAAPGRNLVFSVEYRS